MNLKKNALALALSLGLGLSVGYASAEEVYIPLISKGFQHQFWQAVKAGADQAGKDLNVKVTFEGPETEAMVDKQIDMLSAALSKKPNAIGFAALDSKAAIPLLKKAQAAKIPVITFDSAVDSDIPLSFAATDNKAASALAADKMAELIGGEGDVAVLVHDQTSGTGKDRRDGFLEQMKAKSMIEGKSIELARTLQAPIVHTLRGKEHIEYDNPYDVGMTGLIGFSSGYHAMLNCDTLIMLGTDFPYRQFYPTDAKIIQVDGLAFKDLNGNGKLDRGMAPHLGVPGEFSDWHWATQLNQARAVALARQLGLERSAAQTYIDRYFARYPGVARYMEEARNTVREHGYVETVFGRRLWLPEIRSSNGNRRQAAERAAINAPMQGTAADLIKLAMVAVQDWLEKSGLKSKLVLQVHDELLLEVPDEELMDVRTHLPRLMGQVAELKVPLVVEVGVGPNWEAAH